jgi:hypothetical protein
MAPKKARVWPAQREILGPAKEVAPTAGMGGNMKISRLFVFLGWIGTGSIALAASAFNCAHAATFTGLSLAASTVRTIEQPLDREATAETIRYRRSYHHSREYEPSFFHRYYGTWPRYAYPGYQYPLDAYTYFYPPFYW